MDVPPSKSQDEFVTHDLTSRFMEVPRPTWDSVKDEPEVKEVLGKPAKTL
jgi:hypothetical protein